MATKTTDSQGLCGRADLLHCLWQNGQEGLKEQSIFLGYGTEQPQPIELVVPDINLPEISREITGIKQPVPLPVIESKRPAATFYRVGACEKSDLMPEVIPGQTKPYPEWFEKIPYLNLNTVEALPAAPLSKQPLTPWPQLWPFLYELLSAMETAPGPDIPKLVEKIAQGQWLKQIPKQIRRHWAGNVCLLLDRNNRVFPFNRDYSDLLENLDRLRGSIGLDILTLVDKPGGVVTILKPQDNQILPWRMPLAGSPVLIVSDLGLLDESGMAIQTWLTFGRQLRIQGIIPAVLMPIAPQAIPRDITDIFDCFSWDRHSRLQRIQAITPLDKINEQADQQDRAVKELLMLLSPVLLVEPTLLRAVRHLLPAADYNVSIESAAWLHRDVEATPLGFYYRPEVIEAYHREFARKAELEPELIKQVCQVIIEHHRHLFPTQRYEEIATLADLTGFNFDGLAEEARQHFLQLLKATENNPSHSGLASCGNYYYDRQDSIVRQTDPALSAWWGVLANRKPERKKEIPDGVQMEVALPFLYNLSSYASYKVQQRGDKLEISPLSNTDISPDILSIQLLTGSPLLKFESNADVLHIQEQTDKDSTEYVLKLADDNPPSVRLSPDQRIRLHADGKQYLIEPVNKPVWAVTIGNDANGLYIESLSNRGERFRWYWFSPEFDGHHQLPGFWYSAEPEKLIKPDWANGFARDQHGLYADLSVNNITQRFRWISPGTFMMGSPEDEPEREPWDKGNETRHVVTLTQGYWLADSACTQAVWQAVMGENLSYFTDQPDNPVEQVSWNDAQQLIAELNKAMPNLNACLPTEAQWEVACRAGTDTPFSFGENITPEQVNYNGEYPYAGGEKGLNRGKTVPVKSLPPNPWGLYEMHGNVWEWCSDWYEHYPSGPATDPGGPPEGVYRVLRGGSWGGDGRLVRSANRDLEPDSRYYYIGFRLALGQAASIGPEKQDGSSESRSRGQASGSAAGQRRGHEAQGDRQIETKKPLNRLRDWLKPK